MAKKNIWRKAAQYGMALISFLIKIGLNVKENVRKPKPVGLRAWEFGELVGCCPSSGGLGHRNLCDVCAHAVALQPLVGVLCAD